MAAPRKRFPSRRMQQHQEEQRPRVCRRLFSDDCEPADPGAHDNILNQISEEIKQELDVACKKYNFDFHSEVPLEGDWVWERMEGQSLQMPPVEASEPQEPPADLQEPPADLQKPPADSQQPPAGP